MNVVVVESPAKAKTINKYLGDDYIVLASYGHVRDLPAKDGSVRPDEDFAMSWEVEDRAEKRVRDIVQALKGAKALFLATDPDREGEAISWHLAKVLEERKAIKGVPVKRVVFNEVTKSAGAYVCFSLVKNAIADLLFIVKVNIIPETSARGKIYLELI